MINMYKAMLVDDEVWVRKGLKEQIDWQGMGITFAGEASDGEEAYKLAMETKPDIILTDIKMPLMDGIQLMELINKSLPDTKVIVISGYSEFELVQKAMVNKAINYILKPINERDLSGSISAAIEEIKKSKISIQENQNLRMTLNQSLPALKEKYMNLLISDTGLGGMSFKRILSDLKINFVGKRFQIAAVNISNYSDLLAVNFQNDDILLSFSVDNIVAESLCMYPNCISFKNSQKSQEHIILLGYTGDMIKKETMAELQNHLTVAVNNLKTFLFAESSAGVGGSYDSVEGIPSSYMEASHALRHLKSQNSCGVMFFDAMKKKDIKDDTLNKIMSYITEHFNEQITLESVAEKFFLNPSYLSRVFKNEHGENFIDYITRIRIERAGKLMLNTDLKAYEIAEMVGYENTNYFSKLFKKYMGSSPTEYREKL